ncbi:MAG: POTRA domain-containing protein [Bacteroidia bacterium]
MNQVYAIGKQYLAGRRLFVFLLLSFSLSNIFSQDLLKISGITVIGTQKTKDWVVLRELTFHIGDTLSARSLESKIERSEQNIYNLGLFNEVKIMPQPIGADIHIIITVKERWYLLGAPILGVEERNTYDLVQALGRRDFRRLVYGLSLSWRNVSGRNETLTFDGQLGFSKRIYVDFFRPALFRKANIDGRIGLRYIDEKEIIIGTEAGNVQWRRVSQEPFQLSWEGLLGARKRFSLYQNLYAEISYQTFSFSDSLYQFQLNGGDARYITQNNGREFFPSLILTFSDDRRDIKSFPLKGYKYQLLFRYVGPKGNFASTSFYKIGATWAHHIPLGRRWNFAYGTHNMLAVGDSIPFFAKNFVGISRSEFAGVSTNLRGYEPYAIDGTFVNMNKAEVKFAVIPRQTLHFGDIPMQRFQDTAVGMYLTAFVDTGYILDESFNNQDQYLKGKFLTGYGVGLNIIGFYDILLRVEYSRNHLNQGGIYLNTTVQIK